MKALVLSTSTNETSKYSESLAHLGHEVKLLAYDQLGNSESMMYARAKEFAPDFIVYIGSRWGQMPSPANLARLNFQIAPMVHICSDAADQPWWDMLMDYHDKGAFTLQVAIDGSPKWPLHSTQMTALTPVDPTYFPSPLKPHFERGIICGYAGNAGSGGDSKRTAMLSSLLERKLISLRIRSNLPYTYESYCEFLANCRFSVNIAWTGTEGMMHVKGRVLETGLAGACLLETAGSPTSNWFTPGEDYLEYSSAEEAENLVKEYGPLKSQEIADSLRRKVAEHTFDKFWGRIFDRIGLKVPA